MLKINFYPESDKPEWVAAAKIYQKIWDTERARIVHIIEKISGLKFQEKLISALVYEGISFSHPLRLRASYPTEVKKATLIHELCHRLLVGSKIEPAAGIGQERNASLEIHKTIFLILYDIWVDLYGEEFAKRNVKIEAGRALKYKKAWDWTLSLDRKSRIRNFSEIVAGSNP